MIICLGPPLPTASSGTQKSGRGSRPTVVPGPCSRPGFTEPAPLDAAGALLPHPCTLTCAPGRPGPSAVCFCGTVLTVTRTGRYPAGLAVREPGLSSTDPAAGPEGPTRLDRDHLAAAGAAIDARDDAQRTPLHVAAFLSRRDAARALVRRGGAGRPARFGMPCMM